MRFSPDFFEEETRCGFTVTPMMKRSWAACIEVLLEIDRICKKYDIKYYVYYGTLLGAVRHAGFVPWDDDVDIVMLRADYEKFFMVAPGELKYGFKARGHIASEYDYALLASVMNRENLNPSNVHYADEEEVLADPHHGCPYVMGVDIFVFDYISDDTEFWNTQRMLFMALYDTAHRYEELVAAGEFEGIIEQLMELTGTTFDYQKPAQQQLVLLADRIAAMTTEDEASTVAWMQTTAKSDCFNNIDKHKFDSMIYVPFENITVPVPVDSDGILTVLFGDYMTPVRFASGHDYPVYRPQDEWLGKQLKPKVIIGVSEKTCTFKEALCNSKRLNDAGINICFENTVDNTEVIVDSVCDCTGLTEYDDYENEIIKLAKCVRGTEIDKLTGVNDHNSFYFCDCSDERN